MTRLFRAELLKLTTLRSTWGWVVLGLLFAGLITAGNIGGTPERERLEPEFQSRMLLDGAFPAVVLALLMGIVLVTNEFRHGTIARTLLALPRRERLVALKLATGAFTGAVLMLAMLAVIAIMAVIWLGAIGVPLEPGQAADGAWRAVVATIVAGTLGAAIGGAAHSQVGALVGALVWIFVLEPVCWVLLGLVDLDGVSGYLPAAALGGSVDSSDESPSWAVSTAVVLGYAVVATALALARTTRRDIT